MKILVSNEIYGIKSKKSEKKNTCNDVCKLLTLKNIQEKSSKISFELNPLKGFNSLLKDWVDWWPRTTEVILFSQYKNEDAFQFTDMHDTPWQVSFFIPLSFSCSERDSRLILLASTHYPVFYKYRNTLEFYNLGWGEVISFIQWFKNVPSRQVVHQLSRVSWCCIRTEG